MPSELTPSVVVQAHSIAAAAAAGSNANGGGRGSRRRRNRNGASRSSGGPANHPGVGPSEEEPPRPRPPPQDARYDASSSALHATASRLGQNSNDEGIERKDSIAPAKNEHQDSKPQPATTNNKNSQPKGPLNNNVKNQQPKNRTGPAKKRRNKQKPGAALWKKLLPEDCVDPITLDPLASLKYPPFALVAEQPYLPIGWPMSKREDEKPSSTETEEQRQARILHEQWGVLKAIEKNRTSPPSENANPSTNKERHVNLFDGRALAYYMVSQLQFIDPLNRRDLTRDEIVHLDQYLRRHKFFDLNVTEAYDAKGITISTAGATAQTARGRATILQEEARHLLNSLFGSRHDLPTGPTNAFAREYQEHEASRLQQQRPPPRSARPTPPTPAEDTGVYGAGTAYLVIDDDLNPGLRAGGDTNHLHWANAEPRLSASADSFSPRHARETQFPPLAATTTPARTEVVGPPTANLPKTKTLSKISSLVQKNDPEEQQRQWHAREAAIRKAALVNRSFSSVNPVGMATAPTMPSVMSAFAVLEPTDGQIQRNMAFAEALGVQPATLRTNLNAGWTRPSDGTDEFGNELAGTIYPQTLALEARNLKPGLLVKMERKWKMFLADDKSASLSLTPMDRPTRKTIHEYAELWRLQTESFDPEPKRYIHCVKLLDTRAPTPLLSEVLYQPQQPTVDRLSLFPSTGQLPAREMPQPPIRTPLALHPRSDEGKTTVTLSGMTMNGLPSLSMSDIAHGARFEALSDGRERPKLDLAKRTLPLELPAFQLKKDDDEMIERLREKAKREKAKKEKMEQRAKMVIESAFASDDEDDHSFSSESEWEEQTPLFVATDEDA
jgi:R3H domain